MRPSRFDERFQIREELSCGSSVTYFRFPFHYWNEERGSDRSRVEDNAQNHRTRQGVFGQNAARGASRYDGKYRVRFDFGVRVMERLRTVRELGQNAVFGGRVHDSSDADDAVADHRINSEKQKHDADSLDDVSGKKDARFRMFVGHCPNDRRENDIGKQKSSLNCRKNGVCVFALVVQHHQRNEKDHIVSESGEELCEVQRGQSFFEQNETPLAVTALIINN